MLYCLRTAQPVRQTDAFTGSLILVPSRLFADQIIRRDLPEFSGETALPGVGTIASVLRSMYRMLPGSLPLVDSSAARLILRRAVRSSEVPAALGWAAEGTRNDRTLREIHDALDGQRERGGGNAVYSENPSDTLFLSDLSPILELFEKALVAAGVADGPGADASILWSLSEQQFNQAFHKAFPGISRVTIAGVGDPGPLVLRFLERLPRLDETECMVWLEAEEDNQDLFAGVLKARELLLQSGYREDPEPVPPAWLVRPAAHQALHRHIAKNLFRSGQFTPLEQSGLPIRIVEPETRLAEAHAAVAHIKDILANQPTLPLPEVCILLPDLDRYRSILTEQLDAAGIPWWISDPLPLAQHPLIADLAGLLALALDGFRSSDVARFFGSPFFTSWHKGLPAGLFEEVSERGRIEAGIESWSSLLSGWIDDIRAGHFTGLHAIRGRDASGTLLLLKEMRKAIRRLHALVLPLATVRTTAEWAAAVHGMIQDLELFEAVETAPVPDAQRVVTRLACNEFLHAVDDVGSIVDGFSEAPASRVGDECRDALLFLLRERRMPAFGNENGIRIAMLRRAGGVTPAFTLILGLEDGMIPLARERWLNVRVAERELALERLTFARAVVSWSSMLLLSCPVTDNGRETVRSVFLDAFLRLFLNPSLDRDNMEIPLINEAEAIDWYSAHPQRSPAGDRLRKEWERVQRSAGLERGRKQRHPRSEYEGFVGNAHDEGVMWDFARGPFSISDLETYRNCPFLYFIEKVLCLRTPYRLADESLQAERGSLVHEVLFAYFSRRRQQQLGPLSRASRTELQKAVTELRQLARTRLAHSRVSGPLWEIERTAILGVPGRWQGSLAAFVEAEHERVDEAEPGYFEVTFGTGGQLSGDTDAELSDPKPVFAGSVPLKGRIDRIDIGDDFFVVIDYKTGAILPSYSSIARGESLQLPLYLHAAEQLFARRGIHRVPAAAMYYRLGEPTVLQLAFGLATYRGTAFPAPKTSHRTVGTAEELREVIGKAITAAEMAVEGIRRGEFPMADDPAQCVGCPWSGVCRKTTSE